jgi:hypothetical protein
MNGQSKINWSFDDGEERTSYLKGIIPKPRSVEIQILY